MAIMLCVTGALLSAALYLAVGSPFLQAGLWQGERHVKRLDAQIATLQRHIDDSGEPDGNSNAAHWLELATLYTQRQEYTKAEDALKHAVVASEGHPDVIMAYGKAQMAAADGTLTEGAKQAFTIASELSPENPEPLLMLAIGHMQAGETQQGRALLEKALPLLPEDSPMRAFIAQRMKDADAKRAQEKQDE